MAFYDISLIYYYSLHLKHLLNSVVKTMTTHPLFRRIWNGNWTEEQWLGLLKPYFQVVLWSC